MISEHVKRAGTAPLYLQAWLCGRHGMPGCRAALAVQTAAPHELPLMLPALEQTQSSSAGPCSLKGCSSSSPRAELPWLESAFENTSWISAAQTQTTFAASRDYFQCITLAGNMDLFLSSTTGNTQLYVIPLVRWQDTQTQAGPAPISSCMWHVMLITISFWQ